MGRTLGAASTSLPVPALGGAPNVPTVGFSCVFIKERGQLAAMPESHPKGGVSGKRNHTQNTPHPWKASPVFPRGGEEKEIDPES